MVDTDTYILSNSVEASIGLHSKVTDVTLGFSKTKGLLIRTKSLESISLTPLSVNLETIVVVGSPQCRPPANFAHSYLVDDMVIFRRKDI